MISKIKLLTKTECTEIVSEVHNLKEFWIHRHPVLPFYTLGRASYIDACEDKCKYYDEAKFNNTILQNNFQWLYSKLLDCLIKELNSSVCYAANAALPGFHIFLAHRQFEQPMASIHRDLQYKLLDWPFEHSDTCPSISFTLAIEIPENGGGLNIWDLHHEEIDHLSQIEVSKLILSREKKFYEYEVGSFILHSGHQVHQIAPGRNLQPTDQRITLQGHGLMSQGTWYFYW
jgi:hypothetical protein